MKFPIAIYALMAISLNSCYYDTEENLYPNPPTCDTIAVSYSNDIIPIFESKCYSCHGNNTTVSVIEFEGYAYLIAVLASKNFLAAINRSPGAIAMPLGADKLPDCQIYKIEAWIHQGKQNN